MVSRSISPKNRNRYALNKILSGNNMPYKRRTPYKKRTYKKRPAASKAPFSWKSAAIGAISGVGLKLLKSKLGLNTENKWVDTVETNVGTSSTCTAMANPLVIPVGDDSNSRDGMTCRITSYTVRGRIQANTAATSGCMVRILFVKANDIRGTAITAADFLDSQTRITSFYNKGDRTQSIGYNVLYDRTFSISVSGTDGDTQFFSFSYKPLSHHLRWDAQNTDGSLTDLAGDQIRGYIMTSESGANTPNYFADHRLCFVDN